MNGASKNSGIPGGSRLLPWEGGPDGLTWLPDTLTEVQLHLARLWKSFPLQTEVMEIHLLSFSQALSVK